MFARMPLKSPLLKTLFVAACVAAFSAAQPAHAYVDLAPTLNKVISESDRIAVVEVVSMDRANHQVTMKEVRVLKGTEITSDPIVHDVAPANSTHVAREILQWASPGNRGVLFTGGNFSNVCMGEGWYEVQANPKHTLWRYSKDRPDLPLAYHGSVPKLADAVDKILANKEAVITVVAFGADNEGASFDLALNRQNIPGLARVQRIRASQRMSAQAAGASNNAGNIVGKGAVDEDDIPALTAQLKSTDPTQRASAADDLGSLGRSAKSAASTLKELLTDADARVRFSAASALLRITPKDTSPISVLFAGLASNDEPTRRAAAKATGFGGPAAAPLVDKLIPLVNATDEATRITAIQAITLLGPTAAAAVDTLIPLLDNSDYAIDAADALGRIGEPAQPALPKLTAMLSSKESSVQWAAVRAMAQIGGPDAHPAVDFMVKAFPNANEVQGYNMMIYFSLLGPVASDALPQIRSRIKNPVLPTATQWAIAPDKSFPWQGGGGGGGGPGGFGGGRGGGGGGPGGPGGMAFGGGMGGGNDIASVIYVAYVHELGYRLRSVSPVLAEKIMAGTAGSVPVWGYRILAAGPKESLAILTPYLDNAELAMRERATVALGFMGTAAAPAKGAVESALAKATDEREKRLLQWCLRQITADDDEL